MASLGAAKHQIAGKSDTLLDDDHWGKGPGTAGTGTLVEASQAFIEEALAPQADHVASDREGGRNLVMAVAVDR